MLEVTAVYLPKQKSLDSQETLSKVTGVVLMYQIYQSTLSEAVVFVNQNRSNRTISHGSHNVI